MEEIKIYHSIWKNLPTILISLVFTILCIYALTQGKGSPLWVWAGLLFFGLGGLFMLFMLLRERLFHKPYITITDDKVIVNHVGRIWEYNLADIHRFDLHEYRGWYRFYFSIDIISVHYKRNVEARKMNEAKGIDRMTRKMSVTMMNAQEGIKADQLTMKPKQLCNLLNKRLKQRLMPKQS
jgi:hypothetical protein